MITTTATHKALFSETGESDVVVIVPIDHPANFTFEVAAEDASAIFGNAEPNEDGESLSDLLADLGFTFVSEGRTAGLWLVASKKC